MFIFELAENLILVLTKLDTEHGLAQPQLVLILPVEEQVDLKVVGADEVAEAEEIVGTKEEVKKVPTNASTRVLSLHTFLGAVMFLILYGRKPLFRQIYLVLSTQVLGCIRCRLQPTTCFLSKPNHDFYEPNVHLGGLRNLNANQVNG